MTVEERRAHWRAIINNQAMSHRRRLREQSQQSGGFVELKPGRSNTSGVCLCLDGQFIIEADDAPANG